MNLRLCRVLCLCAVLPLLTGCPSTSGITLGVWLFNIGAEVFGAEFLPNGEMDTFDLASVPDGATTVFGGTMTWGQSGSRILIVQNKETNLFIYTGAIASATSIVDGTYVLNANGPSLPWSAIKRP